MSKVITFNRYFPGNHPRKGQPTYFVEKIWQCFCKEGQEDWLTIAIGQYIADHTALNCSYEVTEHKNRYPVKKHTIRAGRRWKAGDKFSPRVWSGKPYQSTQITIMPDIEIKRIVDISVSKLGMVSLGGQEYKHLVDCKELANNDGLETMDFSLWLPNEFEGQILIWDDSNLDY